MPFFSASELVDEIIGDDDESYEEDYYDEECEDYYSPYNERPPTKPDPEPEPEPIEHVTQEPLLEPTKIYCNICGIEVAKELFKAHEQSKKHRGILVDRKIEENREKQRIAEEERIRAATLILKQVFSNTGIIERILYYLPSSQLLSARLVCREWNEYLVNPESVQQLYFLSTGCTVSFNNIYNSGFFKILKLFTNFVLDTQIAVDNFVNKFEKQQIYSQVNIRIDLDTLVKAKWTSISTVLKEAPISRLYIEMVWNRNDTKPPSAVISQIYEHIFSAVASNKNILEIESTAPFISNVKINPLDILKSTTTISKIWLSSNYFGFIENSISEVDKVKKQEIKRKREFSFDNVSVKELKIYPVLGPSFGAKRGRWLIHGLSSGKNLIEKLIISDLSLNEAARYSKAGEKLCFDINEWIASNPSINHLDISLNYLDNIDLNSLGTNSNLETLNLNNNTIGPRFSSFKQLKKNDTLKHLHLSHCAITEFSENMFKCFPSGLLSLDLSNNISGRHYYKDDFLEDFDTITPSLLHLDLRFNNLKAIVLRDYILDTTTLRTINFLEGNDIGLWDDDYVYWLEGNRSIVNADIERGLETGVLNEPRFEALQKIFARNSCSTVGRKTKAIR